MEVLRKHVSIFVCIKECPYIYLSLLFVQVEEAVARLVSLMPADSICADLINWTPQVALSGTSYL